MNADVYQAFTQVNPLARVWQPRGLNWVLLSEEEAQQRAVSALTTARQDAVEGQRSHSAGRPARPQSQQQFRPQAQAQPSRFQQRAQGQSARAPEQQQAQQAQQGQTQSMRPQPRPDPLRPLPSRLPTVWAQRLNATRRGLIVWTYAALGQDLLGVQSEGLGKRRAFLGQLLRDLNHPGGTHTFWPVTLPASSDADAPFEPNPDAFWAGMPKLGARAVVALGDDAVQALGLPEPLGFMQQMIYRGVPVLSVWHIDDLLHGEASAGKYNSMLDYVRRFLSPIIARAYPD